MNDTYLKKYFLYSLVFHCSIIILGIALSHSTTIRHTFIVLGAHSQKTSKTLFKRFESRSTPPASSTLAQRSSVPIRGNAKKVFEQKKVQPVKKVSTVKKEPVKLAVKQKPGVSFEKNKQNKPGISKPVEKKQPEKKIIPLKQEKKVQEKKDAPVSKMQKREETEQQKPLKQEAVFEQTIQEKLKSTVPPVTTSHDNKILEQNFCSDEECDGNNVLISFTDRDMIVYERVIRQEVGQRWQPPLGVPKGTECTVRFEIAHDGAVKNAEFVRRSNVLIFDLSTLRAARMCTFAECLWGKTFQVDFRQ